MTHGNTVGRSASYAYTIWANMHSRCSNVNNTHYKNYGARGIGVCKEWSDFQVFLADMGTPRAGDTIERIDNMDGYKPGNCRWATRLDQGRNKRNNRIVQAFGKSMCLSAWQDETGIRQECIRLRLNRGWSPEESVSIPPRGSKRCG
jgi:hypothetical protein